MFTILKTIQTKRVIGYSYCSKKDFKKGGEVGNDHLEKTSVGKPEVGPPQCFIDTEVSRLGTPAL